VSLIPLTLVLYRIIFASQPTLAASVCRPAILLVCCALAMFWYGSHVSSVEHKLIRVVAVLCGALLVTSLLATNPERALQEWIKLALMCVIAIALCRPLVHPPNAMVLGASLVLAGAVFGILIVVIYVKYMSWALHPTRPLEYLRRWRWTKAVCLSIRLVLSVCLLFSAVHVCSAERNCSGL
jgi:hypothetical protein